MSKPVVLFLGGGRRVELAGRFRDRGCDVVGYEAERDCPLAEGADIVVGLPWSHPDFPFHLRDVCDAWGVKAIVPLQDAAVVALANAALPAGVEKVCSSLPSALRAFDKVAFEAFCQDRFPCWYPTAVRGMSAVIKPRFGFGSKDVRYVEEFVGVANPDAHVAQAELPEPEYTVDCFFAKCGGFVGACPRLRVRFAGGEVSESVTVENDSLVAATKELGLAMGLRGPACFQFRFSDDEPQVLECNARFGGGSTLSFRAGLDMVDYVVREYVEGRPITGPPTVRPGVRMVRSFRDHYFEGSK